MPEPLIFEKGSPGRRGYSLPPLDVPRLEIGQLIPKEYIRNANWPGRNRARREGTASRIEKYAGAICRLATTSTRTSDDLGIGLVTDLFERFLRTPYHAP